MTGPLRVRNVTVIRYAACWVAIQRKRVDRSYRAVIDVAHDTCDTGVTKGWLPLRTCAVTDRDHAASRPQMRRPGRESFGFRIFRDVSNYPKCAFYFSRKPLIGRKLWLRDRALTLDERAASPRPRRGGGGRRPAPVPRCPGRCAPASRARIVCTLTPVRGQSTHNIRVQSRAVSRAPEVASGESGRPPGAVSSVVARYPKDCATFLRLWPRRRLSSGCPVPLPCGVVRVRGTRHDLGS